MATLYVGTVKSNAGLIVRSGPGTNYPIQEVSDVMYDEKIYIYDLELNGSSRWGRVSDDGWICISNGANTIVEIQNATNQPTSEIAMYSSDTSADLSDEADYYTGQIQEPASSASFPTSAVTYNGSQYVTNATMRLFGLPYQFTPETDPRYETISPLVGREFAEKFFMDGCIAYIIPGKANFLPGAKRNSAKRNSATALIGLSSDDLSSLKKLGEKKDSLRFYDFQEDYTSYINYVNLMCRTVAGFLEIRDQIQITQKDGTTRKLSPQNMDWKDYRWTQDTYIHGVTNTLSHLKKYVTDSVTSVFRNVSGLQSTTSASTNRVNINLSDSDNGDEVNLNQIGQTQNYIPFYIDPSISGNESASNSTNETTVSQKLREVHSQMNEYGFLLNSASAGTVFENLGDKADSLWGSLTEGISGFGNFGNIMGKFFDGAKQVITGENIVIPKIYDSSEYGKSYNVTVHLRTPYGDKLSVFMDIIVPMLHLMALALPKQSTANTYGSPFLIKMYIPGTTTCNLGIISSIQISKNPDGEAWSVDGLPTAVDVELTIEDLYSSLYMSSTTQPVLFAQNSSLIEYLGTISGMNLITPKLVKKVEMIISNTVNTFKDIPGNAGSLILDTIEHNFQDLFNL